MGKTPSLHPTEISVASLSGINTPTSQKKGQQHMSTEQLNHINQLLQLAAEDLRAEEIAEALYGSTQQDDDASLTEQRQHDENL